MMRRTSDKIKHNLAGVAGVIILVVVIFNLGYVVRGYEDGGYVGSLLERVRYARTDERNQCTSRLSQQDVANDRQIAEMRDRASLRDKQVQDLYKQNERLFSQNSQLIALVRGGQSAREATLSQAISAASAAKGAAAAATVAASAAVETSKKLDSATYPTAIIPKPWTRGK